MSKENSRKENVKRLLSPRSIAVFGGKQAAEAIRQCKQIGFQGAIWPVHPRNDTIEGFKAYRSVDDLPEAPDASFIAVPREATIDIVSALANRGSGGAVCYASGFSEVGGEGIALQHNLVRAADDMAIVGPNCYGVLNYLDGAALWPDQHGGERIERGVAIITQSGNIGLNLTMQQRMLPLAYLIAVGNQAKTGLHEYIEALLDDPRVTTIGLHIEGLSDVSAFSKVALKALQKRIPLVALKCGSSKIGAQITMSHTSSLAGADGLYDAFFKRFGIARVKDPASLIETPKFLHVHGALSGKRIISASCSGGEASLMADLAETRQLEMPAIPAQAHRHLHEVLGDKVNVANPLDYHTYIWANLEAQTQCFTGLMECGFDSHILLLDFPREDRCTANDWLITVNAFIKAKQNTGANATVLSSLPECMPETIAKQLMEAGISPMQGVSECLDAIHAAATIGEAQQCVDDIKELPSVSPVKNLLVNMLDEWASKQTLAKYGLPIPEGKLVTQGQAAEEAERLGFPVVVKAVSNTLAHKTEAGGVKLNIKTAHEVRDAVSSMQKLAHQFLIERMAQDVIAELIVGVHRDPQFGLALTVGAGGIWVELLKDAVTVLLPTSRDEIFKALTSLKTWPLLNGYRGKPLADINALLDAIMAVAKYAEDHADKLQELDVNPLLALPIGAVAVDALIRLAD